MAGPGTLAAALLDRLRELGLGLHWHPRAHVFTLAARQAWAAPPPRRAFTTLSQVAEEVGGQVAASCG